MGLIILAEVEAIFQKFDDPSQSFDEVHLPTEFSRIRQMLPLDDKAKQTGAFAEIAAWYFSRSEDGNEQPWGIYWRPVATRVWSVSKIDDAKETVTRNGARPTQWESRG